MFESRGMQVCEEAHKILRQVRARVHSSVQDQVKTLTSLYAIYSVEPCVMDSTDPIALLMVFTF